MLWMGLIGEACVHISICICICIAYRSPAEHEGTASGSGYAALSVSPLLSTNSVVRLNQTHAVNHNICGLCVPRVTPSWRRENEG